MKVFEIIQFIGLVSSCSYREDWYKDDETCSGTPFESETYSRMTLGKCFEDGVFLRITDCRASGLTVAVYDEDSTCAGEPSDVWEHNHGECAHQFNAEGEAHYARFTMLSEDEL